MKRFEELTPQQQREAKETVFSMLLNSVKAGIITNIVSDDALTSYAEAAAEDAFYSEKGDLIVDNVVDQ